jgi:MOSC domain-containing protein YiiM
MDQRIAEIFSINVAMPAAVEYQSKSVETGIFKQAVTGPLFLSKVNFAGDGQGDRKNHGGPDKAVCFYSLDHYAYWQRKLGKILEPGAFGENVTVRGLTELDTCIGDRWRMGESVVEVSQPRQPCFKLAMKHGVTDLVKQVQDTGYTGFYFRVIEEGHVAPGDQLFLVDRHPQGYTIDQANKVMYGDALEHRAEMKALLDVAELSDSWRKALTKKLQAL